MKQYSLFLAILVASFAVLPARAQIQPLAGGALQPQAQVQSQFNGTDVANSLNPATQVTRTLPAIISNLFASASSTITNLFSSNQQNAYQATLSSYNIVTPGNGNYASVLSTGQPVAPMIGTNGMNTPTYLSLFGYQQGYPTQ